MPDKKPESIIRFFIPPLTAGGSPGEATIAFIPTKFDVTGLHNAIGITYRPPISALNRSSHHHLFTLTSSSFSTPALTYRLPFRPYTNFSASTTTTTTNSTAPSTPQSSTSSSSFHHHSFSPSSNPHPPSRPLPPPYHSPNPYRSYTPHTISPSPLCNLSPRHDRLPTTNMPPTLVRPRPESMVVRRQYLSRSAGWSGDCEEIDGEMLGGCAWWG